MKNVLRWKNELDIFIISEREIQISWSSSLDFVNASRFLNWKCSTQYVHVSNGGNGYID